MFPLGVTATLLMGWAIPPFITNVILFCNSDFISLVYKILLFKVFQSLYDSGETNVDAGLNS